MAEEQEDRSQATEEPTQKRIEDAVKKGNVAYSREVTSFIMISLFTIFLIFIAPPLVKHSLGRLTSYVTQPDNFNTLEDADDVMRLALAITLDLALIAGIPFAVAILGTFLGGLIQNGVVHSPEAIVPSLSKISPLNGFKRIFSMKSVMEMIKGIIKLTLVGVTAWYAVYSEIAVINNLHDASIAVVMSVLLSLTTKMLVAICVIYGILAALDYFWEKFNYLKKLRMTKQEVKDEYKEMEGNPEIKAKVRALRFQRSRRRIMAAVPKADVIITNPTHFAVALQYDPDTMPAPKVLAKGADVLAQRIREIARDNGIPIIENPPLARALFDNVDWDETIPGEYYKAVAQIMMKLKKFTKRKR